MENKFKVGDVVYIKEDFVHIHPAGRSPGVNDDMVRDSKKFGEYTISEVNARGERNWYLLEEVSWIWAEDWLEEAHQFDPIDEDELMEVFSC